MLLRLFVFVLMSAAFNAHAGFVIEPYAGYAMGNYKVADTAGDTASASVDGFTYGGRVGINYGYFFLGGDYQASRAQLKLDGKNESTSWNNTSIFGVLGLDLGFGLRIHAGMTVTPHESEAATSPERTLYKGKAKKAGITYRYYNIPFAINAEYVIYELNKFQVGETKGDVKDFFSKMNYSAVILSLSFPFEIGGR